MSAAPHTGSRPGRSASGARRPRPRGHLPSARARSAGHEGRHSEHRAAARRYGLVGESGCGKSTAGHGGRCATCRQRQRIDRRPHAGATGSDVSTLERRSAASSGAAAQVAMVYQDPTQRPEPGRSRIGRPARRGVPLLTRAWTSKAAARARPREPAPAWSDRPIPSATLRRYPHRALRRPAAARRHRHGAGRRTRSCSSSTSPPPASTPRSRPRSSTSSSELRGRINAAILLITHNLGWSCASATGSACSTPGASSKRVRPVRSSPIHGTPTRWACSDACRASA